MSSEHEFTFTDSDDNASQNIVGLNVQNKKPHPLSQFIACNT